MTLLRLLDTHFSLGTRTLLNGVEFTLSKGDRVALIGRNGEGKSTLLHVIAGDIKADAGTIEYQQGLVVRQLEQNVPNTLQGSIKEIIADGLGELGHLLAQYYHLSECMDANSDAQMAELTRLQDQIEQQDGWSIQPRIDTIISQMSLPADARFEALSGGLKRRVLLGRALVQNPDVLLLDEPTNHLDIEAIRWMETLLNDFKGALVFITHDRSFLRSLANRIVELDRGTLKEWSSDYDRYLEEKAHALQVENEQNALFDKKLQQEEAWIRQGIKARRTRNEGRVRALKALREERRQRLHRPGETRMQIDDQQRSGRVVIEAQQLTYAYPDSDDPKQLHTLVKDFDVTLRRGDKVGLIGPNGIGKSTLIRLLLKELNPSAGQVKHGTQLELAYFDQMRAQLDLDKTVRDNVGQGSDHITIGSKSRHIMSYLQDFLFSPERANTPVSALSGGERNRVLLAKLFTKTVNLLVLDEPTNDLDIETIELLESLLVEFNGTLLLVSHDRDFLNNVVTMCWAFEGQGQVTEYIGSYDDYERQRPKTPSLQPVAPETAKKTAADTVKKAATKTKNKTKLSYKDQRELDELPQRIEALEQQQDELHQRLSDPSLYQTDPQEAQQLSEQAAAVDQAIEEALERWEQLESAGNA